LQVFEEISLLRNVTQGLGLAVSCEQGDEHLGYIKSGKLVG